MSSKNTFDHSDFKHPSIIIEPLNKKLYSITIRSDASDKWMSFLDDALEYDSDNRCWIVNTDEINSFVELIENVSEDVSGSEYSSEEESTDDELVQKTLERRLKSSSKQYEIEDDHVSDSELEDVIAISRRLRFLYKTISNLSKRVDKLESK
jgi:hypothetical protein